MVTTLRGRLEAASRRAWVGIGSSTIEYVTAQPWLDTQRRAYGAGWGIRPAVNESKMNSVSHLPSAAGYRVSRRRER